MHVLQDKCSVRGRRGIKTIVSDSAETAAADGVLEPLRWSCVAVKRRRRSAVDAGRTGTCRCGRQVNDVMTDCLPGSIPLSRRLAGLLPRST